MSQEQIEQHKQSIRIYWELSHERRQALHDWETLRFYVAHGISKDKRDVKRIDELLSMMDDLDSQMKKLHDEWDLEVLKSEEMQTFCKLQSDEYQKSIEYFTRNLPPVVTNEKFDKAASKLLAETA